MTNKPVTHQLERAIWGDKWELLVALPRLKPDAWMKADIVQNLGICEWQRYIWHARQPRRGHHLTVDFTPGKKSIPTTRRMSVLPNFLTNPWEVIYDHITHLKDHRLKGFLKTWRMLTCWRWHPFLQPDQSRSHSWSAWYHLLAKGHLTKWQKGECCSKSPRSLLPRLVPYWPDWLEVSSPSEY